MRKRDSTKKESTSTAAKSSRKKEDNSIDQSEERIKIMRRDLKDGGFDMGWGFYPTVVGNLADPYNVERLWNMWNKLRFDRGCKVAHQAMLVARNMREEVDEVEMKVGIMQERYEV